MTADGGEGGGWGQEPADGGFDPRSILEFVKRWKLVILIVTLPLLVPATAYPLLMRDFYEATATVVIRVTPEVMEFGPDFMPRAADARTPGRFGGAASENALITLATSDAILGRVVDMMPTEQVEERKSVLDAARNAFAGSSDQVRTPEQNRVGRIQLLRHLTTVTVTGGGNYLEFTAVGGSAGTATFLVNSLADAFVKYQEDQREEASRRAVAWLNQQLYELRDQASRKEQTLSEIVSTNKLSPSQLEEAGSETATGSVSEVEGELQGARISLMATEERLSTLSPRAAPAAGRSDDQRQAANLRAQYEDAVAALDVVRLRFTPTHPEVRRLEAIVANLAQRLGSDTIRSGPPLSETEDAEYQRLLTDKSQETARVRVLEKALADLMVDSAVGPKAEAVSRYRRLANEIAIDKQILEELMTRRNATLLTAATKEMSAAVLDHAVAPSAPTGPNRKKYFAAGYVLALGLGFGVAFLLNLIDRRLRDPNKIAALLGTTSLGMVPKVEKHRTVPERQTADSPGSPAGESYRNVRTSLLFAMRATKLRCLLVTSAVAGEGKTTTCVNLASAFGRLGRRVVLVDADMRRGRVHRVFRLPASPGLAEILQGEARPEDAIVRPDGSEFDLIPAGAIPDNPSELLLSAGFSQFIAELKNEYDLIILDSAILLSVPDALLLAADADGTLLVHKPGSVDRHALRRVRDDLQRANARVLGVVFNQVDARGSLHYSSYLYSPYITEKPDGDDRDTSRA